MYDYLPWKFICKTCGEHRLTVSRVWLTLAGPDIECWQESGPLKANHLWSFKTREKVENELDPSNDDEVRRWDFNEYTRGSSPTEPKKYKILEGGSYLAGDKFYVNCAGCGREIEFGWSGPNRGGRIYPVECSDFVPEEVWADPKYMDLWRQRGWLRKGRSYP